MKKTLTIFLLTIVQYTGLYAEPLDNFDKVIIRREVLTQGFDLSEDVLLSIGDSYLKKGDYKNAKLAYQEALSGECIYSSRFYFRLAHIAATQGDRGAAKMLFAKAVTAEAEETYIRKKARR